MITKWVQDIRDAIKDWRDLVYNSHSILRDYRTYDETMSMPIYALLKEVNYFSPKIREIAKRQESERFKMELQGKGNMRKPGGIKG